MSRMWEVDPETRAKLLQLSKTNGNEKCCDCGAPSPQWASPKFGTFICLNCAGTHRGLGVHISFVRSITMDAFKTAEIHRMENSGNEPWKSFFDNHPITQSEGRTFDDSTIKERYEGEVGEEWKERLSAKVEGREYVPGQVAKKTQAAAVAGAEGEGVSRSRSGASTPLSGERDRASGSPSMEGFGSDPASKKDRNEAFFAKLGSENATRSEGLPPSQGGKYTGFGGGLPASSSSSSSSSAGPRRSQLTQFDDFQKDPVATFTKGLGWFASTVGKSAKTVNDSYIQPTAKTIAESDFAAQARVHAAQVGQNIQVGARGAADSFNRFVEGDGEGERGRSVPDKKDFWDDFSSLASSDQDNHRRTASRSSAIGTAAMKKPGSSTAAGATGTTSSATSGAPGAKGQDEWGDDNW